MEGELVTSSNRPVGRYPIRAVSKLTGIGIDTLRAWERRYGVVAPRRDGRGRLYSDADVARLRLVHQAVAAGHSVGRVAGLGNDDLRELTDTPRSPTHSAGLVALDTTPLRTALATFDGLAVDRELARLATVMQPDDLVRNVVLPVARDVGAQWNARKGGIAEEHLISATLRHLLGAFLRVYARPDRALRFMFATPSGDRHELGILAAALLAASRGIAVCYLGPDLPADELAVAAESGHVQVLVLGITLSDPTPRAARELRTLAKRLPEDVALWAGGPAAQQQAAALGPRGVVLPDFDAYTASLDDVLSRHRA